MTLMIATTLRRDGARYTGKTTGRQVFRSRVRRRSDGWEG